ncbi:hypothetical protein TNCV_718741 [Trichonephila clavipes]|nr:hypothetical protein TNCV_718741 [Trichonephila clavipes]
MIIRKNIPCLSHRKRILWSLRVKRIRHTRNTSRILSYMRKLLHDGKSFQLASNFPFLGTSGVQEEFIRVRKRDRREDTIEVSSTRTTEDNEA